MADESADRGDDFARHVLAIVDSIPPGSVLTYGDIAALLGSRAARAVGRVMSTSTAEVPWWRVVRASGQPAAGHEATALARLAEEGTPMTARDPGRVDLDRARHRV